MLQTANCVIVIILVFVLLFRYKNFLRKHPSSEGKQIHFIKVVTSALTSSHGQDGVTRPHKRLHVLEY